MTQAWQFVGLLAAHWLGDFFLQTHWQASNKSKNNDALLRHVLSYTGVLAIASGLIFGVSKGWAEFVWLSRPRSAGRSWPLLVFRPAFEGKTDISELVKLGSPTKVTEPA